MGIVYLDEVDKLAKSDSGSSGEGRTKDVGGLGVQQVRPLIFWALGQTLHLTHSNHVSGRLSSACSKAMSSR